MRRRLLTAMLLVAVVAVAGFGIPLALSVQARYRDEALLNLSEEAATAAVTVPGSFTREQDVPELPKPVVAGVQVALYRADGRRIKGHGPTHADPTVRAVLRGAGAQRQRDLLVVAVPVSEGETVVGAIRTSIPNSVVVDRTRRTWLAMAALAVGVLAAAAVFAVWRSRSLARPLARLRADAEFVGEGGEVPTRPDIGVVEIDAVHAALAAAATRLNAALARERSLSADLAHQLRTPLASLRLRLENEPVRADRDAQLLSDALRDVDRLEQTIADLLALARDTERERTPHALGSLVRDAAVSWAPRLSAVGRRLDVDLRGQLPWVEASPGAIRQILDVLLDNAVIHGEGDVLLSCSRVGHGAVVAVADHGHATVDRDEIFVRRNPTAAGSGIGLALAKRLAEAEEMRLVLADPGPGVVFHLVFGGHAPTPRHPDRSRMATRAFA